MTRAQYSVDPIRKTDTRLTASFPGQLGKSASERILTKQETWSGSDC